MPNWKFQRGQAVVLVLITVALLAIAGYYFFKSSVSISPKVKYSWIQYGPENSLIARAITSDESCPKISINFSESEMNVRASKDKDGDVIVCEKNVPQDATQISVAETQFKIPVKHPKKILVIGDSGCRMKAGKFQDCNSPEAWPFAEVAKTAAEKNPDLIIHVGDYLYREEECPAGNQGCAGSPVGYHFKTLEADFLAPAKPLLSKAPWILIRGNHEICSRAGNLWFRFLDPYPYQAECQNYSKPYFVDFENIKTVNIDSSFGSDYTVVPAQVSAYKAQLDSIKDRLKGRWLISHKPVWSAKVFEDKEAKEKPEDETEAVPGEYEPDLLKYKNGLMPEQRLVSVTQTLESAVGSMVEDFNLIVAGHYHNFEMFSFDGVRPAEIISGNTGTLLEDEVKDQLNKLVVSGQEIAESKFYRDW